MLSHKERLISFLKKDVGGAGLSNEQIKQLSSNLKELGIIDMSEPSSQEWLINDKVGQSTLITIVTWFTLGLLSKMVEIKLITKGK